MADKILRDKSGKEIGRLVKSGIETVLKDRTGRELGRYNEKADVTRDRDGTIIGRGNLLTFLFGMD